MFVNNISLMFEAVRIPTVVFISGNKILLDNKNDNLNWFNVNLKA